MTSDDTYRYLLQATIEGLRYWVPSIADLAHVEQLDELKAWHLLVKPKLAGACAFDLSLRADQRYDLVLAGQEYANRPVSNLALFLPLAEAIVDGNVVQRRWISSQTGVRRAMQTLVALPDGALWREGDAAASSGCEVRDRHFLPYRR